MFRAPLMRISTGVLFAGQLFTVSADGDVGTCDPATGSCSAEAGDDMSALQVRSGFGPNPDPDPTDPDCKKYAGCGKYWEFVDAEKLGDQVPYSKKGDPYPNKVLSGELPECLQGLAYMDQWCTTYPKMPKKERTGPCLGMAHGHYWVNEQATAFGNWDEHTRCFTAERKAWVFGQADISEEVCRGPGITACMKKKNGKWPHDVCETGAEYEAVMPWISMGMTWSFIKTDTAWSRKTPISWFQSAYYPVHIIVNGTGHETKWYKDMLAESMQTKCPAGSAAKGGYNHEPPCRRSQWAAHKKLARCTHSSIR